MIVYCGYDSAGAELYLQYYKKIVNNPISGTDLATATLQCRPPFLKSETYALADVESPSIISGLRTAFSAGFPCIILTSTSTDFSPSSLRGCTM